MIHFTNGCPKILQFLLFQTSPQFHRLVTPPQKIQLITCTCSSGNAYLERQHITGGQVDEQVEVRQCVHVLAACELMHVLAERREILQVSKTPTHLAHRRVVACPGGNSGGRIDEVTPRQAQLVLRRVTVQRYTIMICHQLSRPTQPPTLSKMEMYTSQEAVAVFFGWKGNRRSSDDRVVNFPEM